ncbi:MAG: WapI family immunity protein [Blastocatellia bacterium]
MSDEIEIAGQGASLKVEVLRYENISAQDLSDANWLSCSVQARVGSFSGNFSGSFTTNDFAQFRDELRELLARKSGTASFLTDEEQLRINLEVERTGTVQIEGSAQTSGMPQACLSFSFESDMSFLDQTLRDLEKLVKSFPVKEKV